MPQISLPAKKVEDSSKKEISQVKIVELGFDFSKKEPVFLIERQAEIIPGESNFDRQQRLAEEEIKRITIPNKKIATRDLIPRERNAYLNGPSLEEKRSLVKEIASRHGIPWQILEAVWQVESGKSWDTSRRSYAGAIGPMQFLPSTFRKYASSSSASITSAVDSLDAAAKLLASTGASRGEIEKALFAYNHSRHYVKKVLKVAKELGY